MTFEMYCNQINRVLKKDGNDPITPLESFEVIKLHQDNFEVADAVRRIVRVRNEAVV